MSLPILDLLKQGETIHITPEQEQVARQLLDLTQPELEAFWHFLGTARIGDLIKSDEWVHLQQCLREWDTLPPNSKIVLFVLCQRLQTVWLYRVFEMPNGTPKYLG